MSEQHGDLLERAAGALSSAASQGEALPLRRACWITEVAPTTSTLRNASSPARVITPSLTLPAVEWSFGVKPIQAANWRPDRNWIRFDGVLHGLVTWGIATLLTFWLLSSAIGSVIGGGFSALGSVASATGSSVSDAAKPLTQAAGVSPDMIQQQAQAYLQPTNPDPATMSPQDAQKAVATNLTTYAGGGTDAAAAKERVISIMAAQ